MASLSPAPGIGSTPAPSSAAGLGRLARSLPAGDRAASVVFGADAASSPVEPVASSGAVPPRTEVLRLAAEVFASREVPVQVRRRRDADEAASEARARFLSDEEPEATSPQGGDLRSSDGLPLHLPPAVGYSVAPDGTVFSGSWGTMEPVGRLGPAAPEVRAAQPVVEEPQLQTAWVSADDWGARRTADLYRRTYGVS